MLIKEDWVWYLLKLMNIYRMGRGQSDKQRKFRFLEFVQSSMQYWLLTEMPFWDFRSEFIRDSASTMCKVTCKSSQLGDLSCSNDKMVYWDPISFSVSHFNQYFYAIGRNRVRIMLYDIYLDHWSKWFFSISVIWHHSNSLLSGFIDCWTAIRMKDIETSFLVTLQYKIGWIMSLIMG